MPVDAQLGYRVWMQLIADEELYGALIAGTHHDLAASRRLGAAQLAILDELRAQPGTRWNIENLRFRTALEAGSTLASYLPRTMRMLTKGDENWLQDICFEYLAFHRWSEHGHHRFAECLRFGTYVRERIMKRRMTPPHFDVVLEFELAVIRLLMKTAGLSPEAWPTAPVLTDDELAATPLARSVVSDIVDLPVDIRQWVESVDPLQGEVRPEPVTFLMFVPSLRDVHKIKVLSEGARVVLDQLDGVRPVGEIAVALEDEYGIEPPQLMGLVRTWLGERLLVAPTATRP